MNRHTTGRDLQRTDFIENLYKSLNKKTQQALASRDKWIKQATQYIQDGMAMEESVELLMIDGLSRQAATGYIEMVMEENGNEEYSFQFEDSFGRVLTSSDLGKFITASSEDDAWAKAEEYIFTEAEEYNPEKIISVNKISED
jgi:hypothetical protein